MLTLILVIYTYIYKNHIKLLNGRPTVVVYLALSFLWHESRMWLCWRHRLYIHACVCVYVCECKPQNVQKQASFIHFVDIHTHTPTFIDVKLCVVEIYICTIKYICICLCAYDVCI